MKAPKLRALEKNVLKYRALQMILVLHEFESLRRDLINSIRHTDSIYSEFAQRIPPGRKKPFEAALKVIVAAGIISEVESKHLQEYAAFRNRIGHDIHQLVQDISGSESMNDMTCLHDYWAVNRIERYREKISQGMMIAFVQEVGFSDLIFKQAELTYKEEIDRLDKKIQRQIAARLAKPGA